MVEKLNLTPDKQADPAARRRRTGLRVIVLLVLVGAVASLNYVDLGFLFRTPKNTAEVEIPRTDSGVEKPASGLPGQTEATGGVVEAPPQAASNATSGASASSGQAASTNATTASGITDK